MKDFRIMITFCLFQNNATIFKKKLFFMFLKLWIFHFNIDIQQIIESIEVNCISKVEKFILFY